MSVGTADADHRDATGERAAGSDAGYYLASKLIAYLTNRKCMTFFRRRGCN